VGGEKKMRKSSCKDCLRYIILRKMMDKWCCVCGWWVGVGGWVVVWVCACVVGVFVCGCLCNFRAGTTPALPEEKSQEPPIKRISSKPTKAPSISTSTPKPQVDNQSQQGMN